MPLRNNLLGDGSLRQLCDKDQVNNMPIPKLILQGVLRYLSLKCKTRRCDLRNKILDISLAHVT